MVFFGFLYQGKGFEKILKFADPTRDRLLVIGDMDFDFNPYTLDQVNGTRWGMAR